MLMFEELLPHTEQNILMHKLYEAFVYVYVWLCSRVCVYDYAQRMRKNICKLKNETEYNGVNWR